MHSVNDNEVHDEEKAPRQGGKSRVTHKRHFKRLFESQKKKKKKKNLKPIEAMLIESIPLVL